MRARPLHSQSHPTRLHFISRSTVTRVCAAQSHSSSMHALYSSTRWTRWARKAQTLRSASAPLWAWLHAPQHCSHRTCVYASAHAFYLILHVLFILFYANCVFIFFYTSYLVYSAHASVPLLAHWCMIHTGQGFIKLHPQISTKLS